MFTLKLYRYKGPMTSLKTVKAISVHRVVVHEMGEHGASLEVVAFTSAANNDYETYYIGEPEAGMEAFGKDDLHLDTSPHSWWGWGLLENELGRTTERYRPSGYDERPLGYGSRQSKAA